jgi:IS1 family transposase
MKEREKDKCVCKFWTRCAKQTSSLLLGCRAEIKISVRVADENTRYVILYACRTRVKIGQSHIRAPRGGECDTRKRGFLLQYKHIRDSGTFFNQ